MHKLDLKDKKILYELDKNCRQSNSQIARKVGFSKQIVNYRIMRLEKQKIIEKYLTQLNLLKFGFLSYKIMIQFQNVNLKKEKEIISHLQKNKDVHWIVSCFGNWDLMFAFSSRTIMDLNKNLNKILGPFEKYIKERKSLLVTDLYHFTKSYLVDKKEREFTHFGGEPQKTKIDDLDLKIIKILSENARESIVEIASKLKITIDIARYRIKKLIKDNVIQSFRVVINKDILDYQYWNVLIKTKNLTKERENQIISFFKNNPNIIYSSKYIDTFDIGFELEVKDIEELSKILTNFRYNFSDTINHYETILFFKEHKLNYLPIIGNNL